LKLTTFLKKAILPIILLLIVDQVIKILVKTNMAYNEHLYIFGAGQQWAQIHFIENPGMAFGFLFGGINGKIILSIFRIIAIIALTIYLYSICKKKFPGIAVFSIILILAGAMGNLLDSAFYGLIFDSGMTFNPEYQTWIPYAGVSKADFSGYAGFLKGSVVDMFYFPMLEGHFPSWFPDWSWWPMKGGQPFLFFSPVFNFADSMIFVGVVLIFIFRKKFTRLQADNVTA
jgi:signal peptidase II